MREKLSQLSVGKIKPTARIAARAAKKAKRAWIAACKRALGRTSVDEDVTSGSFLRYRLPYSSKVERIPL